MRTAVSMAAAAVACPCGDASLCRPLATPAAAREILAFTTGESWRSYLGLEPKVTTVAVFGTVDPELVCKAHQQGARVVVGVEMDKAKIPDPAARTQWVDSLVPRMAAEGIDGFNLDIEGNTGNREAVTALVKELAEKARAANPHAQLSFDLSIYPQGQTGGYEHKELAQYLDFILPMSYDLCWGAGAATANSPLAALSKGIQQYSDLGVPASKIVMGLPWYGWDFPCDDTTPWAACKVTVPSGKPWYGYVTQQSYTSINATAVASGSRLDAASQTMFTEEVDGAGQRHQRWFDNPGTLRSKYHQAASLGCRGVGFWTADEVDWTTGEGADMWSALAAFSHDVLV